MFQEVGCYEQENECKQELSESERVMWQLGIRPIEEGG